MAKVRDLHALFSHHQSEAQGGPAGAPLYASAGCLLRLNSHAQLERKPGL